MSTTFIIRLRIDSDDRLINTQISLKFLLEILKDKVILVENGPISNYSEIIKNINPDFSENLQYIFQENHDSIFHPTKIVNSVLDKIETEITAIYDIDVLLPIKSYREAEKMILDGFYDLIYPFRHDYFYTIEQKDKPKINLENIQELHKKVELNKTAHKYLVGFVFYIKTEIYKKNGGENELFIGYGYEDDERFCRFTKLGYRIGRINEDVYHLEHWRGINSWITSPNYIKNRDLFFEIRDLTLDEYKFWCLYHQRPFNPAKVVIPYLQGCLGNQLFQMASGYGLSRKNRKIFYLNQEFAVINSHSKINYFETIFSKIPKIRNILPLKEFTEQFNGYSTYHDIKLSEDNYVLKGYFQNERYFENYRNEILDIIKLPRMPELCENPMFIHLRFLSENDGGHLHDIDLSKYLLTIREFLKDKLDTINFYLFSNDITAIKSRYDLNAFKNLIIPENLTELETLSLMSQCHLGGICSNSSLSWWGAYLNTNPEKIIFFPDQFLKNDWKCDIYQKGMIIVNV